MSFSFSDWIDERVKDVKDSINEEIVDPIKEGVDKVENWWDGVEDNYHEVEQDYQHYEREVRRVRDDVLDFIDDPIGTGSELLGISSDVFENPLGGFSNIFNSWSRELEDLQHTWEEFIPSALDDAPPTDFLDGTSYRPSKYFAEDKANGIFHENSLSMVRDIDWISYSFMVSTGDIQNAWQKARFFCTADRKYTTASLGASLVCNPKPQFCRYADTRRRGRRRDSVDTVSIYNQSHNLGQGEYYSSAFDDNKQVLFMEFGVAEFNSIFNFLNQSVDAPQSMYAKGLNGTFFYDLGKTIGAVWGAGKVIRSSWKVIMSVGAIVAGKTAYKSITGNTHAKYYWLKPGMFSYWSTVSQLVTTLAIEMGIVHPTLSQGKKNQVGAAIGVDQEELGIINDAFGELLTSEGYIDVMKIMLEPQAIMNAEMDKVRRLTTKSSVTRQEYLDTFYGDVAQAKAGNIKEYVGTILGSGTLYKNKKLSEEDTGNLDIAEVSVTNVGEKITEAMMKKEQDIVDNLALYFRASLKGGSRFAVFGVEYKGEHSVSFRNSIKDIPTKTAMNGLGGISRDVEFTTAGMNLFGVGMDAVVDGVLDVAQGALASITFGGSNVLLALLSGGFVEMPKMWADSEMEVQTHEFKMDLPNLYNHPISRIKSQLIPMMMVVAGGAPLATGSASYTSPFLCNAFIRGLVNVDLGMITQVTISSGDGNLGRDDRGIALSQTVTWTVSDFSTIMAAPVVPISKGSMMNVLDDTNPMMRWLASVGGRELYTNQYASRKALLRLNSGLARISQATDPAFLASMVTDMIPTGLTGLFIDDVNLVTLEGR